MNKMFFLWMGIAMSAMTWKTSYAQEKINLELLFNNWAISSKESTENLLILRNPSQPNNLFADDLNTIYIFKIGLDSVVCTSDIKNHSGWICGSQSTSSKSSIPKKEIWSLEYENNQLTRGYYFGNDESPVYAGIYKIMSLNDNYLKLQLIDEVFNE